MTGSLCFEALPSPSPSASVPSSQRVTLAYSIDSFAEFSSVAVSRTPTRVVAPPPSLSVGFNMRQDEELFRDLFGAEAEGVNRGNYRELLPQSHSVTKKVKTPSKGLIWATGATLSAPFGPPSLPAAAAVPRRAHNESPSLNAPFQRQNVTELLTARPLTKNEEPSWDDHGLTRVPEVEDEDEDERDKAHPQVEVDTRAKRRVMAPASPGLSLKKSSPLSVQEETLQFLEKLDLKALLSQPRPDVKSFYPSAPVPGSNQLTHVTDPRDEDELLKGAHLASSRKASGRKEHQASLTENTSRLAHMALTYGTTASEPRKARKETLERLANPILGHTSTLQALSSEQRKRREAENNEWVPTSPTPSKTIAAKKIKPLIDRLSQASSVYEAAASATTTKTTRKLVKGKKPAAHAPPRPSSNQEEVEAPTKHHGRGGAKASHDQRKALLRQTLANRQADTTVSMSSGGTTFLTQHEESEAKLATRSSGRGPGRRLVPSQPALPKPVASVHLHMPQRPVVPLSVRSKPTAPGSTTNELVRPRGIGRPTFASTSKSNADATRKKEAARTRRKPSAVPSQNSKQKEPFSPARSRSKKPLSSSKPTAGHVSSAMLLEASATEPSTHPRTPKRSSLKSNERASSTRVNASKTAKMPDVGDEQPGVTTKLPLVGRPGRPERRRDIAAPSTRPAKLG